MGAKGAAHVGFAGAGAVDVSSTVAVTLVFTDLVGSTAIGTSLHPDETERLRQTHFAIISKAVVATGGNEVKNLGDGLMVAFSSPSRALACAIAMQQGIDRHNRRAEVLLAVRIGIAGGEVTEDEGDYFGDPVVEAARLCMAADGGQILATDTVRAMVGRHATVELASFGELDLKGIPHPVSTVEVQWTAASGDDDGVPLPARLAEATTTVLPFAGRAAEFSVLDDVRVRADTGRLQIALLGGEPGVGKTSLTAQCAQTAHRKGATVTFGSCQEGLNVPYLPWITALGHLVAHAPESALASLPARPGRSTAWPSTPLERAPCRGRGRRSRSRHGALPSVRGGVGAAVVDADAVEIDDRRGPRRPCTARTRRPSTSFAIWWSRLRACGWRFCDLPGLGAIRGHPLSALLAELRRESAAIRVRLAGLADGEVMELMEVAAGQELPAGGSRVGARALP